LDWKLRRKEEKRVRTIKYDVQSTTIKITAKNRIIESSLSEVQFQ